MRRSASPSSRFRRKVRLCVCGYSRTHRHRPRDTDKFQIKISAPAIEDHILEITRPSCGPASSLCEGRGTFPCCPRRPGLRDRRRTTQGTGRPDGVVLPTQAFNQDLCLGLSGGHLETLSAPETWCVFVIPSLLGCLISRSATPSLSCSFNPLDHEYDIA